MQVEEAGEGFFAGPMHGLTRVHVQMAGDIVAKAREQGLIVITAGKGDVIRLVPPLIITDEDVDIAVRILSKVIKSTLN
jgi:4-aminobutyrate aminotransferase-like enzyme